MNKIKVLFFATLRDKAGVRSAELEITPGATIQDLKTLLVTHFPRLADQDLMSHCLAAINHDYKFDETVIPDGAEVALFPPVSGG